MFEAYSSIDILENATANGHVATWLWWRWKSLARGGAKACSLMSGIRDSMFCLYLGNEIFFGGSSMDISEGYRHNSSKVVTFSLIE